MDDRDSVVVSLMSQGRFVGTPRLVEMKRGWRRRWTNTTDVDFSDIPEGFYPDLEVSIISDAGAMSARVL